MKKGLFVGLTTLDYIYYVDEYPENDTKVKTNSYKRYVGGPAANAAVTYALLGGDATLVTCLGSSNEASMIEDILAGYGVKVINCADDEVLPCVATISVDSNGRRTIFSGQNVFENVRIPGNLNGDFYLFDLNQQEMSEEILDVIQSMSNDEKLNDKCGKIVLDAGSWKGNTEDFIKAADIIISSENFKNPSGQNLFEMVSGEDKQLAITGGDKDILLKDARIPVKSVECVDSNGAGDIFHGAFCYAYFELEKGFEDALAYASDIATESVKYFGPREWKKQIK